MLLSKIASMQVLSVFDLVFRVRNCSEEALTVSWPSIICVVKSISFSWFRTFLCVFLLQGAVSRFAAIGIKDISADRQLPVRTWAWVRLYIGHQTGGNAIAATGEMDTQMRIGFTCDYRRRQKCIAVLAFWVWKTVSCDVRGWNCGVRELKGNHD